MNSRECPIDTSPFISCSSPITSNHNCARPEIFDEEKFRRRLRELHRKHELLTKDNGLTNLETSTTQFTDISVIIQDIKQQFDSDMTDLSSYARLAVSEKFSNQRQANLPNESTNTLQDDIEVEKKQVTAKKSAIQAKKFAKGELPHNKNSVYLERVYGKKYLPLVTLNNNDISKNKNNSNINKNNNNNNNNNNNLNVHISGNSLDQQSQTISDFSHMAHGRINAHNPNSMFSNIPSPLSKPIATTQKSNLTPNNHIIKKLPTNIVHDIKLTRPPRLIPSPGNYTELETKVVPKSLPYPIRSYSHAQQQTSFTEKTHQVYAPELVHQHTSPFQQLLETESVECQTSPGFMELCSNSPLTINGTRDRIYRPTSSPSQQIQPESLPLTPVESTTNLISSLQHLNAPAGSDSLCITDEEMDREGLIVNNLDQSIPHHPTLIEKISRSTNTVHWDTNMKLEKELSDYHLQEKVKRMLLERADTDPANELQLQLATQSNKQKKVMPPPQDDTNLIFMGELKSHVDSIVKQEILNYIQTAKKNFTSQRTITATADKDSKMSQYNHEDQHNYTLSFASGSDGEESDASAEIIELPGSPVLGLSKFLENTIQDNLDIKSPATPDLTRTESQNDTIAKTPPLPDLSFELTPEKLQPNNVKDVVEPNSNDTLVPFTPPHTPELSLNLEDNNLVDILPIHESQFEIEVETSFVTSEGTSQISCQSDYFLTPRVYDLTLQQPSSSSLSPGECPRISYKKIKDKPSKHSSLGEVLQTDSNKLSPMFHAAPFYTNYTSRQQSTDNNNNPIQFNLSNVFIPEPGEVSNPQYHKPHSTITLQSDVPLEYNVIETTPSLAPTLSQSVCLPSHKSLITSNHCSISYQSPGEMMALPRIHSPTINDTPNKTLNNPTLTDTTCDISSLSIRTINATIPATNVLDFPFTNVETVYAPMITPSMATAFYTLDNAASAFPANNHATPITTVNNITTTSISIPTPTSISTPTTVIPNTTATTANLVTTTTVIPTNSTIISTANTITTASSTYSISPVSNNVVSEGVVVLDSSHNKGLQHDSIPELTQISKVLPSSSEIDNSSDSKLSNAEMNSYSTNHDIMSLPSFSEDSLF